MIIAIATACRKRKDDVSKVVVVPTMQVAGEKFISIRVGDPMPADEGATVVNDAPLQGDANVKAIENTVDVNTPGMYYMLYQTKTKNGYTVGAARYIAVTNYDDTEDLSGTYTRTANGIEVEVERLARGLYVNKDMGGAGLSDALYFTVINDTTIAAGPQFSETIGDVINTESESLLIEPDAVTIRYALDAPGYGTAVRTFIKEK